MPSPKVTAVLFAGLTQLDLTGPAQVLATAGFGVSVAATTADAVMTDCGFSIVPETTFGNSEQADILLVPGGPGVNQAMLDPAVIEFVQCQAERATWVTSVCSGSLLLGAAGLLRGRRATCHWASLELLTGFEAEPVPERVVSDGRLITAAGVTAGIDLAFELITIIGGEKTALETQLRLQYDPAPLFTGDVAALAPQWAEQQKAAMRTLRQPLIEQVTAE